MYIEVAPPPQLGDIKTNEPQLIKGSIYQPIYPTEVDNSISCLARRLSWIAHSFIM